MSRPHVVFVTEGGPDVGLGHLGRCRSLARALSPGARVSALVASEPRAALFVAGIPGAVTACDWTREPAAALDALAGCAPDVVVVDSYKAMPDFLSALGAAVPTVVAVDDLADRPLPVDIVVNGGVAAPSLPYQRRPDTLYLLGSRYALLDPCYADLPARAARDRVTRILITLGGGRNARDLLAAVRAADALLAEAVVDVAAGPFAAREVDAAARAARHRVVVHRDRVDLGELIGAADVAVCGAGMTLYELAASGTPAVTVCMADNQRPNAEAFASAGAAPAAGAAGDPDLAQAIEAALRPLVGDRHARAATAARARGLVDGRGALRVARHLLEPARVRR